MIRTLLIGTNGQVGYELSRLLSEAGDIDLITTNRPECDLARPESIRAVISKEMPKLIINAAAYTAVDKAEQEQDLARQVNADALVVIAEEASKCGAAVIHYSTDYVFDGSNTAPYREDEQTQPINHYGLTKCMGEEALISSGVPALIFRTSWVYGVRGSNFLLTMHRLMKERDQLSVVDDQRGAPTWCRSIARATVEVIASAGNEPVAFIKQNSGIYHMTCGGETSWFEFACAIAERMKQHGSKIANINHVPTTSYPTPAKRPMYSVLDNTKLDKMFSIQLPGWADALDECMQEM